MGKSNKMVFKKAREAISAPRSQKSSTANTTSASKLPTSFKIVAGSYEKLLYGLEGNITASARSDYSFDLRPIFIFPAHVSCIKTVAASPTGGKWLATGSADEIVKVWDLRRKKEIGGLMHHEGSVYVFHPLDIYNNRSPCVLQDPSHIYHSHPVHTCFPRQRMGLSVSSVHVIGPFYARYMDIKAVSILLPCIRAAKSR